MVHIKKLLKKNHIKHTQYQQIKSIVAFKNRTVLP